MLAVHRYSLLLGSGVRLGLERSTSAECKFPVGRDALCFPADQVGNATFGLRYCNTSEAAGVIDGVVPGTWPCADCYVPGGNISGLADDEGFVATQTAWSEGESGYMYTFDLNFQEPQSVVYDRFRYLVDRGWFDDEATFLTIQLFLLNAELGLFNQVEFVFEIERSGSVSPRQEFVFQVRVALLLCITCVCGSNREVLLTFLLLTGNQR